MGVPENLKRLYREGRILPFVGAGVSQSVVWEAGTKRGVSWRALVDQAARELGHGDANLLRVRGTDLQILEYYRLKTSDAGLMKLRDWFRDGMNPPDSAISDSPILSALVAMERCKTIYTTNYDDFIERALVLGGRSCTRITTEKDQALKYVNDPASESVDVVKFHGDLNQPSKMVLSETDYDERMRFITMEDRRFQSEMVARALLFIGYSFRDYNVSYLFRTINEHLGALPESANGSRGYILLPDPSDFEHQLFGSRNIEIIELDSLHIAESVTDVLREVIAP